MSYFCLLILLLCVQTITLQRRVSDRCDFESLIVKIIDEITENQIDEAAQTIATLSWCNETALLGIVQFAKFSGLANQLGDAANIAYKEEWGDPAVLNEVIAIASEGSSASDPSPPSKFRMDDFKQFMNIIQLLAEEFPTLVPSSLDTFLVAQDDIVLTDMTTSITGSIQGSIGGGF